MNATGPAAEYYLARHCGGAMMHERGPQNVLWVLKVHGRGGQGVPKLDFKRCNVWGS